MADEGRLRPAPAAPALPAGSLREAALAWVGLTKPRITALVVLTAAASFGLASGPPGRIWVTILATALLSSGIFALNQYLERDADGRMVRTRRRALPSGRVPPGGPSPSASRAQRRPSRCWRLPFLRSAPRSGSSRW